MFNVILALFAGILIGWNFHSFFLALDAPKILRDDFNISQTFLDKNVSKNEGNRTISPIKFVKQTEEVKKETAQKVYQPIKTSFYSLLHNGLFSDAMALYQQASYERILFYRSTLKEYFEKENMTNQEKTIRELLEYIAIDPENGESQLFLSKIYKERKEYEEAIKTLNELIEANTHIESDILYTALIDTARLYIDSLKKSKSYQELQTFLETQIRQNIKSSFFTFALAEYHVSMQSFNTATILLKDIEFDDEYGERAKALLLKIEKNETNKEEYAYKLPLRQEGSHFTIDVTIDDTPLTLLLDTGATLTFIDEEKLPSSLTLINDNIKVKTTGGEISAQLKMAQSFTVGEIKLKDFKITTSSFTQENADGLLGMNFFQKFKFKIDQEKSLLFLSKKE